MRNRCFFQTGILICLVLGGGAAAHLTAQDANADSNRPPTKLSFVIKVTEFRWTSDESPPVESAAELLKRYDELKNASDFTHLQTLRFAAVENTESHVQFETETAVTVGVQQIGTDQTQRITQAKQIGTTVQVRFAKQGEKILMDFDYRASRFNGEGTDFSPPDTTNSLFQSVLILEPGKPTFVGGMNGKGASFLIVTLEP